MYIILRNYYRIVYFLLAGFRSGVFQLSVMYSSNTFGMGLYSCWPVI